MGKIDGQGGEGGTSGLLLSASKQAAYIGTAGSGHLDPIIPWVRDICLVETLYVYIKIFGSTFLNKENNCTDATQQSNNIFLDQKQAICIFGSFLQQFLGLELD